ncbi:hypothetical protein ACFY4B_27550 [Kitasatospora sp. NPDC001261]|uniref:hypothetical protein n=1 Tax=Kitasatospora sp. NPDC001261 TaxID=3364012 RepID=UPI003698B35D
MTTTPTTLTDATRHVLDTAAEAATAIAAAIQHIGPCQHLPAWPTKPITMPADVLAHQQAAHTFHTRLTTSSCTCLHGLPEQLLADLSQRWAATLQAGAWYGQSARRSSAEVRDHSRKQFDTSTTTLLATAEWITSGTAALTARATW